MRHISAPETAALVGNQLTEAQARVLERDVARCARVYGRATARVRKLRALLKVAENEVRERRREMRLLISARQV
jgi:hypothetical protein